MKAPSTAAFAVTRYVVSAPGAEHSQFRTMEEAEAEARQRARRAGEATLYIVIGEPVTDLWREPRLLASYREAPISRLRAASTSHTADVQPVLAPGWRGGSS